MTNLEKLITHEEHPQFFSTRYINVRKSKYTIDAVKTTNERKQLESQGWELIKRNKKSFKMRLPKR
ncbi:MAG: hypothetical protein KAU50_07810, partial [Candidatus Marinimicrobia bacterium]|nr:hypothetical protein [Candidatus Neomarinimicrobiota bacterium]